MTPSLSSVTHFLVATPLDTDTLSDGEQSPDSLFDEPQESPTMFTKLPSPQGARTTVAAYTETENVHLTCTDNSVIARQSAPPIPGLFFDPALLLPADLAESVLHSCMSSFFADPVAGINQVMLFGRAGRENGESSAFPPFLSALLAATSALLRRHPGLPRETHAMLFPERHELEHAPRARQAIVNLYRPGEGIKPHVDLLRRFGDGIVGVSLGSGAVMQFAWDESQPRGGRDDAERGGGPYEVWLPPRSVLVLTGEARYRWTHGIEPRVRDKVADVEDGDGWRWDERGVRVSVTFRWLLPGAEIVGGDSDDGKDDQADRGRRGSSGNEKT